MPVTCSSSGESGSSSFYTVAMSSDCSSDCSCQDSCSETSGQGSVDLRDESCDLAQCTRHITVSSLSVPRSDSRLIAYDDLMSNYSMARESIVHPEQEISALIAAQIDKEVAYSELGKRFVEIVTGAQGDNITISRMIRRLFYRVESYVCASSTDKSGEIVQLTYEWLYTRIIVLNISNNNMWAVLGSLLMLDLKADKSLYNTRGPQSYLVHNNYKLGDSTPQKRTRILQKHIDKYTQSGTFEILQRLVQDTQAKSGIEYEEGPRVYELLYFVLTNPAYRQA